MFSDVQAEAVTDALRGVRDTDLSMLVTKADLIAAKGELRTEIAETKYEILKWVLSAIGFQTIVVGSTVVALAKDLH